MSASDVKLGRGDIGRLDGGGAVDFTVGSVLRRFAAILRGRGGALLVFAVLLAGVVPYAVGLAYGRAATAFLDMDRLRRMIAVQSIILGLLNLPFTVLLQGAVAHIGTSERAGLAEALRSALRHFLPNLGIYILSSLAFVVAFALLIVPGLMLICRWLVVIPAEVVEGTGVRGALGRSGRLTRGHRWQILGLVLIAVAVSAVLAAAQFLLASALVGTGVSRAVLIVLARTASVVGALTYHLGATAAYVELRRAKEGGTASEIASVFE